MSQPNETLQKALTKDLGQLQGRLEHYEGLMPTTPEGAGHDYVVEQVKHYRHESSRVRSAVLELHAAALAELKR